MIGEVRRADETAQRVRREADTAADSEPVEHRPPAEGFGQRDGNQCRDEGESPGIEGHADAGADQKAHKLWVEMGVGAEQRDRDGGAGRDAGGDKGQRIEDKDAEEGGQRIASAYPAIIASSAIRSRILSRSLSLFSWPQAARMSRPRGVRIGEA